MLWTLVSRTSSWKTDKQTGTFYALNYMLAELPFKYRGWGLTISSIKLSSSTQISESKKQKQKETVLQQYLNHLVSVSFQIKKSLGSFLTQ